MGNVWHLPFHECQGAHHLIRCQNEVTLASMYSKPVGMILTGFSMADNVLDILSRF